MELFLIIALVVGAIFFMMRRAHQTAVVVDAAKTRLREKAIRDASISNPRGDASDLDDAAMDGIARHATVSSRGDLRRSLQHSDQILVYRTAAMDAGREVLKSMSKDAKIDDFRSALRKRISSEVIDRIADERDEQIDNSRDLREAMVKYAFEELTAYNFSDWEPEDMKGIFAAPCPECSLLLRELSEPNCRSCGHAFDGKRAPDTESPK